MSTLPNSATLPEVIEAVPARTPVAKSEWREEAIRARVLASLGRPAGLVKVTVQPLWADHFRVNVWTGGTGGSAIPDSYFVTADDRGVLLRSEPPIERRY